MRFFLFVGVFFVLFPITPLATNILPQQLIVKSDTSSIRTTYTLNDSVNNIHLVTFPSSVDIHTMKEQLEQDPNVQWVEYNYPRTIQSSLVTDNFSWWHETINSDVIWSLSNNQKYVPKIAIVDSGIDLNHSDLAREDILESYNFYHSNEDIIDENGHGTFIAGIINAIHENGIGIDGVTGPFSTKLLPVRITDKFGNSSVYDSIKGIEYAIENDVDVINLSYGGPGFSMIENQMIQKAINKGIHVVASSGNSGLTGSTISYPASYANVLSVGSINGQKQISSFSTFNSFVDLVAPGENIYTTAIPNYYAHVSGTSFAAPVVSAALAILKAILPDASVIEHQNLLLNSVVDLGDEGRDDFYGEGLIDLTLVSKNLTETLFLTPILQGLSIQSYEEFSSMRVDDKYRFTVEFNETLNQSNAYDEILIFYNGNQINNFSVNQIGDNLLEIAPFNNWETGTYFIIIQDSITNQDALKLNSPYKMTFIVE